MWGFGRRMLEDLATERARREELSRRVDSQQTTIAFLCARVNQLETERALLLRQLTNIDLPVPTLTAAQSLRPDAQTADAATLEQLAALGIFEDSPAHAPAGWHADGSVNYGRLAAPVLGAR